MLKVVARKNWLHTMRIGCILGPQLSPGKFTSDIISVLDLLKIFMVVSGEEV
jgi:hypothetical protein